MSCAGSSWGEGPEGGGKGDSVLMVSPLAQHERSGIADFEEKHRLTAAKVAERAGIVQTWRLLGIFTGLCRRTAAGTRGQRAGKNSLRRAATTPRMWAALLSIALKKSQQSEMLNMFCFCVIWQVN